MKIATSLLLLLCLSASSAADDVIVPGVRVGPVSRDSTEAGLIATLGKLAVKRPVEIGEGMTEPGLVIYPDDPTRRLGVIWNDDTPKHPATVFICYEEVGTRCRWHTAAGIGAGVTLQDLERRNGRSFEMMVWGTDVECHIVDFHGGRLERELTGLMLCLEPRIDREGNYLPILTAPELDAVLGEKRVLSSNPVLQKLNPRVEGMTMDLNRRGR